MINYPGGYPYRQTGPPQYVFGGFELDRLVIPFRGARPLLEAFLAGTVATPWAPSTYDPAMFLSGYLVGTDRVAPEVQLQYLGKKNGILTAGKHEDDDAVLSASSSSSGIIGSLLLSDPVTVQYYGPRSSLTWISDVEGDLGALTDVPDPGGAIKAVALTPVWIATLVSAGTNYKIGSALSGGDLFSGATYAGQVTSVQGGFAAGPIRTFTMQRIVPPRAGTTVANPINDTGGGGTGASFDIILSQRFQTSGLGVRIISLTWRAAELATFGAQFLTSVISTYFHPAIIETLKSEEVVAGHYWRNTKVKTRVLQPGAIIFDQPPGGVQL